MPSFGSYYFYPPITGITRPGLEYDTSLVQTRAREYANANLTNGLRRIGIGGGILNVSQVDEWEAFQRLIKGRHGRFLFILRTRHFEMIDSLIGLGDGDNVEFQLKKTSKYRYGPENSVEEIVRFPWHDYKPLYLASGAKYLDTDYVSITVGGDPLPSSAYAVEREGGLVTFDDAPADGAEVRASCRFAVLCRQSQDYNPLEARSESHLVYTVPSGIEIYEPRYDPAQTLGGG